MASLLPEFYTTFKTESWPRTYVYFQTEEQAMHLFEIFEEAYGVKPGPEMAQNYMSYPNMYVSTRTIEGCGGSKSRDSYTYDRFISECCAKTVQVNAELVSSLL